jgi:hypothetical protein
VNDSQNKGIVGYKVANLLPIVSLDRIMHHASVDDAAEL